MPRRNESNNKGVIRTWVISAVLLAVTAVWSVSQLAEIFKPDFDIQPGVQELMMVIVGALVSARQLSAKAHKSGNEEDEDEPRS